MRILHVLAPAATGGLEQVVQSLVAGLRQRAHDAHLVAVVAPQTEEAIERGFLAAYRATGAPLHIVRMPARAYGQEYDALRRLCRELAPAVVHTHGYRPDIIDALAARRERIPTLSTAHGFTRGGLRNRLYESVQRRAFARFDAVVAVSSPLCDELIRAGVAPGRVHLIRNAAPLPVPLLSREEARQRLGLPLHGYQIGWVGRLSREKGPDLLIDALARIPDRQIGATIIGDGPQHAMLQKAAIRRQVGGRLHFAGSITPAASLLRAFDVLVLSSRTEGTPIVLFEALAAQVPVVATRVGGVPDVIDESCGILVDRPDGVLIARAVINLLANPAQRRQLAQRALTRLHRQFSRGPWLTAHEKLYYRITGKRPAHV